MIDEFIFTVLTISIVILAYTLGRVTKSRDLKEMEEHIIENTLEYLCKKDYIRYTIDSSGEKELHKFYEK